MRIDESPAVPLTKFWVTRVLFPVFGIVEKMSYRFLTPYFPRVSPFEFGRPVGEITTVRLGIEAH
jgi:hypothetical protein